MASCNIPAKTPNSTTVPGASATPASYPAGSSAGSSWWDNAVFYEVFVRSFYDGNGDGKGDFKGLTAKLDYLNDGNPNSKTSLGVKAIWLMPIHPSPSYHGYDVIDYEAINPDYGTIDDFKTFLIEAHKRGIKVIIDLVLNHTSDQNPWFVSAQDPKSDKHDWYVWSDNDPGYLGPWSEKVWYKTANDGYYYAVYSQNMPDLNYRTQAVTDQMDSVASFWLKDIGVDGFRVDGARHLIEDAQTQVNTPETHAWFEKFHALYKSINPSAFTVGEIWDNVYTTLPYDKGDQFDAVFAFDLANAIVNAVINRDGIMVSDSIWSNADTFKSMQYGTFLTNHDMNRVMSQLQGDMSLMKSAAMIYLTAPGIPFIYYGEEIGMTGQKPDESIRKPMQWSSDANGGFTSGTPWESLNPDYANVNVAVESGDSNSLLSWYRQLIQLRYNHSALVSGNYYRASCAKSAVYSGLRIDSNEAVLIVSNLSKGKVSNCALKLNLGPLKGKYKVTSLLGDAGTFADLTSSSTGGFSDYQFLPELPAGANYVLLLTPVK